MLLRYIVNQWINQTARQKVYELVGSALRGQGGAARPRGQTDEQSHRGDRDSSAGPGSPGDSSTRPATEGAAPIAVSACQIGLIFALNLEAGGFVDRLEQQTSMRCASYFEHAGWLHGRRVMVAEAGVGRAAAGQAAADFLRLHQPHWLISAGFAGSLDPAVQRGDVVMATELVDEQGVQLDTGLKLDTRHQPGLHGGRLLTVDHLVRDVAERRALAERHGAVACDMETLAVAQACQRQRTRFISVRVISDGVDDELPVEVQRLLDQKTWASKLGAAAHAIWNRPGSAKDFWQLHRQALDASERLAKTLAGVIANLPP